MRKLLILALLAIPSVCTGQEIRRPTAEANYTTAFGPCSDVNQSSSAMANFYDASGDSTSDIQSVVGTTSLTRWKGRTFTTWAAASGSYVALYLKVRYSLTQAGTGGGDGQIDYSIDGGSSWDYVGGLQGIGTVSITLSPSQNLSLLQIRTCVVGFTDPVNPGTGSLTGYDIRTEGTLGTLKAKPRVTQSRTVLPTENIGRGLILVRVHVNGKPVAMVLDTGTEITILDGSLFGLSPADIRRSTLNLLHQDGTRPSVMIRALLLIGDRAFPDHFIAVSDLNGVSKTIGQRIDGILGLDILRKFSEVAILWSAHQLVLFSNR